MNSGIEKRLKKSLEAFFKNDLEDSLYQIAPAIEATSKKRYPKFNSPIRVKKFLRDEQDLIYGFSTRNTFNVEKDAMVTYGEDGELQKIIYKYIRCSQAHEATPDLSKIQLGGDFGVAYYAFGDDSNQINTGKYIISTATVFALIFSVICADENTDINLDGWLIQIFGNQKISISNFKGKKDVFKKYYSENFSCETT